MPSGTFSHAVHVDAPVDDVWDRLQSADTWAGLGPIDEVWDASHRDDGVIDGYRWAATAAGKRWEGTARTSEALDAERLTLSLRSSEMRGSLTTDLAANDDGTRMRVTMQVQTVGPLSSLFWGVVRTAIERGLPRQVEDFAREVGGAS